jgi:thioredoxin reductase (NADPH)
MEKYDTIVIGAGAAGLTAAIYLRRASKKVLVLEARSCGGQIINTLNIENYPAEENISGFDFAEKIYNQAKHLGAEILFEKVTEIENNNDNKIVTTGKNKYECSTLIIATGSDNRKLGLPSEKELTGRGISYCATCDGAFYKGKTVAVVGGGETAIEDALYLSDIASKIYLIHRRDSFRASDKSVNELKKKTNVEYVYNSVITNINGKDKLESIDVKDNEGNTNNIIIDGLFIAVGRTPENENFAKIVDLDEHGYIIAGEDTITSTPGIFAAGDCRVKKLRQLVTATSDGANAASEAIKYMNK